MRPLVRMRMTVELIATQLFTDTVDQPPGPTTKKHKAAFSIEYGILGKHFTFGEHAWPALPAAPKTKCGEVAIFRSVGAQACDKHSIVDDGPLAKRFKAASPATPSSLSVDRAPSRLPQPQPHLIPGTGPLTPPAGNSSPPPHPPSQWCLEITAGKDFRRLHLSSSISPSYHDILLGVSTLFHIPFSAVESALLLKYYDSEGDSCTSTAATFADALHSLHGRSHLPPHRRRRPIAMPVPARRAPAPAHPCAHPLPPPPPC